MLSTSTMRDEIAQLRAKHPSLPIKDIIEIIQATTTTPAASSSSQMPEAPFQTLGPAEETLHETDDEEDTVETGAFLPPPPPPASCVRPDLVRLQGIGAAEDDLLEVPAQPTLTKETSTLDGVPRISSELNHYSQTEAAIAMAELANGPANTSSPEAHKTRKPRQVLSPEKRCCARIESRDKSSGQGVTVVQCSLSRKNGSEFCKRHHDQATVSDSPLQFDQSGKKIGLFYGRIDQDRPEVNAQGLRCVLYSDQELQEFDPSLWHPATKQAKDIKRTAKKNAADEAALQRQLQKEQEKAKKALAKKPAPKKGNNAFFHFLNTNRSEFARILGSVRTNGESVPPRAADVSKFAGKTWRALTQETRDHWQTMVDQKNTEDHLNGADGGGAQSKDPTVDEMHQLCLQRPLQPSMYYDTLQAANQLVEQAKELTRTLSE